MKCNQCDSVTINGVFTHEHECPNARKKRRKMPTLEAIMEAVEIDDCLGFCIACGEQAYGVEPDARKYECKSCGENAVYGAEELLIMNAG